MIENVRWGELGTLVRGASEALGGAAIAVVVIDRQGVVFENTAGRRDLRDAALADSECLFGAASITKIVTALAMMRLVQTARVSLETRIIDCLPSFAPDDARMRAITIAMLMSHTSGLSGFDPHTWHIEPDDSGGAIEKAARAAAQSLLVAAPGAAFHYSETGYDVLGALLEHIGDAAFEDVVETEVFAPLDMHRTTMKPSAGERRAWPHVLDGLGALRAAEVVPSNRAHAPSGGMQTTPRDLAVLARAILGSRSDWLSPASLHRMSREHAATGRAATPGMGLGFFLREHEGDLVIGHGGLDIGYRCGLSVIPARGVGVVVMTNAMWGPVADLCNAGLDAALGRTPKEIIAPPANFGAFTGRFGAEGAQVNVEEDEVGLWIRHQGRRSRLTPLSVDSFVCPTDDDALNRSVFVVTRDRVVCNGLIRHRS